MSHNFFRGLNVEQDSRWGATDRKLLAKLPHDPKLFKRKVNLKKVNVEVLKQWVKESITEILGFEDDIVTGLVDAMLEAGDAPDPKNMQLQLTGFLEKRAAPFMQELWTLILDAQDSPGGIPTAFVQQKLAEARRVEEAQRKAMADFQAARALPPAGEQPRSRRSRWGLQGVAPAAPLAPTASAPSAPSAPTAPLASNGAGAVVENRGPGAEGPCRAEAPKAATASANDKDGGAQTGKAARADTDGAAADRRAGARGQRGTRSPSRSGSRSPSRSVSPSRSRSPSRGRSRSRSRHVERRRGRSRSRSRDRGRDRGRGRGRSRDRSRERSSDHTRGRDRSRDRSRDRHRDRERRHYADRHRDYDRGRGRVPQRYQDDDYGRGPSGGGYGRYSGSFRGRDMGRDRGDRRDRDSDRRMDRYDARDRDRGRPAREELRSVPSDRQERREEGHGTAARAKDEWGRDLPPPRSRSGSRSRSRSASQENDRRGEVEGAA